MNVLPRQWGSSIVWRTSTFVILATAVSLFASHTAYSMSQVVISGLSTGVTLADEEYIQIANIGDEPADVSGYQIVLRRNATSIPVLKVDFQPPTAKRYLLFPNQRALFVSSVSFASKIVTNPNFVPDGILKNNSSGLVGTGGIVELLDADQDIHDDVYWGDTVTGGIVGFEQLPSKYALLLGNNNKLERVASVPVPLQYGGITSEDAYVDLCPTIDGVQILMPDGYGIDEAGNCELTSHDACANIEYIQLAVPSGKALASDGNCYDIALDVCPNIDGFQLSMPENYRTVGSQCKFSYPKQTIKITELLPNAVGVDTAKEFVELKNDSTTVVDLSDYYLAIGKNAEKRVDLPDVILAQGAYHAFYNDTLNFSLLNTTSRVELRFYDDSLIDEVVPYQNPNDDIAWALIDGVWQYTNIVTPGLENQASAQDGSVLRVDDNSALSPCPEGKYRNLLTNRCRSIESDVAVLGACEADEYRNPETNRCRKIASVTSTLAPCQEGYERNPDTNRCRKTSTDSELEPCKDGYERNPDTNRCRKITGSTLNESADEAVQSVEQTAQALSPYALGAVAGAGVMGYGVYEWRSELASVARRIARLITRK